MQAYTCACKHMYSQRQANGVDTCRDSRALITHCCHTCLVCTEPCGAGNDVPPPDSDPCIAQPVNLGPAQGFFHAWLCSLQMGQGLPSHRAAFSAGTLGHSSPPDAQGMGQHLQLREGTLSGTSKVVLSHGEGWRRKPREMMENTSKRKSSGK